MKWRIIFREHLDYPYAIERRYFGIWWSVENAKTHATALGYVRGRIGETVYLGDGKDTEVKA